MIAHLEKVGGDVETFKAGLAKINDFSSFQTEDEFGLYLQTALRLTGEVDPSDTAKRFYSRDIGVEGAGRRGQGHPVLERARLHQARRGYADRQLPAVS